jgi:hypothetical protein
MARHTLRTSDGEGFLRAFTDAWQDAEADHKVLIQMNVHLSRRRGVLGLTLAAVPEGEPAPVHPQAKYTVEYPTAAVATFEAALYQAMVKLERILDQQRKWPMGKA